MRKLPVYLLIDVSGSMHGEPIEAVKNGIQMLHSSLRSIPQALEVAYLSVITFADSAKQIIPLTEVAGFKPPTLKASGQTCLGAALLEVANAAKREVKKSTPEEKGDWKPLVFIMTDGIPTDNVDKGLEAFNAVSWGMVLACAAGPSADTSVLQRIPKAEVLQLATADSSSITAYFKFISSSIATSSKKVESGAQPGSFNELPPPPPEISLLKH
ncbi:MAG: VWA domain-containing protein [Deltaproteobacteria bacterium]|jgi:uncharacterized protein YegL|nr:VWA domain-containing protein [Deltaproteobacteria bacterium]